MNLGDAIKIPGHILIFLLRMIWKLTYGVLLLACITGFLSLFTMWFGVLVVALLSVTGFTFGASQDTIFWTSYSVVTIPGVILGFLLQTSQGQRVWLNLNLPRRRSSSQPYE